MTFQDYLDNSIAITTLDEMTSEMIGSLGLKGLVVDFDGVLGGARSPHAAPIYIAWLQQRLQEGIKVAIHSNNPEQVGKERRERFLHDLAGVLWMPTYPKKPSPSTLDYLKNRWRLRSQEIAMIDDRMLTGGLAAFRSNVSFFFVKEPVTDYQLAPVLETGFAALRLWERFKYRAPHKNWCTREDSNL